MPKKFGSVRGIPYLCPYKSMRNELMTQRDDKQRMRTSREELGKFFYELANMTFGAMVLVSGVSIITQVGDVTPSVVLILIGIAATALFAGVADKILKSK